MNLSSYSFDSGVGKKKRGAFFYIKIVSVVLLFLCMVTVIVIYFFAKKEQKKVKVEETPNFTNNLASEFGNFYGYELELSVSGPSSMLGSFLSEYIDSDSFYIYGYVYGSGAEVYLYPSVDVLDEAAVVPIIVNDTGVYVNTKSFAYLKSPDDFDDTSESPSYYVRVRDGMRGEDFLATLIRSLRKEEENESLVYGETDDGLYAVEVKEAFSDDSNFLANIIREYGSGIKMSYNMTKDGGENENIPRVEIIGESDNIKFLLDATEIQRYHKKPQVDGTILTVDEFKSLLN